MSEFTYIQMPPDGTGKKVSQTGSMEIHYSTGTINFTIGDVVTTDSGLTGTVVYLDRDNTTSTGEIYLRLNHGSSTVLSIGEQLKVDDVVFAQVAQAIDTFYTQEVILTGGNNPFNHVSVDNTGSMYTRFAGGSMSFDAFGKQNVSQSTTIREYLPVYDTLPEDFQEDIWNAGVKQTTPLIHGDNGDNDIFFDPISHLVNLQTGTQNGDRVRRRSHIYHKYQTGVATTVIFSAFLGDSGKTGVHRQIGLYDDEDGVYFHTMEDNPNGLGVVVRHSVTGSVVEEHYHQNTWNIDRLDGSKDTFNVSGYLLDPTKIQVMFIDFQWLGGGRIRFGFYINGVPIICHEINNANNISRVWSRTGSLPITMEQYNTAGGVVGNSNFFNISAAVKCEGEFKPRQFLSSGSLPPAVSVPILSNYSEYTFIGALRPVKYISYADNKSYTGTVTVNASVPGNPSTAGTITTAGDFVAAGFVAGDYIQFEGARHNNRIIYIVDTVTSTTMTLTTDSPPIFQDTDVVCTITSKKKTPNRAIGEIKDITLMDVSGQNKPLLVELVKNAGLIGTDTGLLTITNIGGTLTGYNDEEIVDIEDIGGGVRAVGQVTVVGGDVTAVNIVQAGHGYSLSGVGLTLTGRETDTNGCTVDVGTIGSADFKWQDAYSGNMVDAAKPSTGVVATTSEANTMYTTFMTGGHLKIDLREHFDRNTELMHRKADLDTEPDTWTIRVKTFNDNDTAEIAFALSWLEVRA